ncbi:MAG: putative transporter, superfamily [Mycobacterium sp.]|nr:putative transporter, superfamily [Mycobacterium sp.]
MTQPVQARPLTQARYAVFALFASFGVVLSTWAVHLPVLQHNVGLSNAMLGTVLLILGAGSLVGMQLSGALVDRVGGGRVATIAGVVLAAAITLPLNASTLAQAIAGAFVLGVAAGCADVGMNALAVSVERDYGRPIMASFHAMFSIGTVVGSFLGAAGFALRLGILAMTAMIAIICLVIVGSAFWALRNHQERTSGGHLDEASAPNAPTPARHRQRVILLGMLAFLFFLSEGSAMDWSSLHAQQRLGAPASLAALAVGSFVMAMTASRFAVDRVAQALGPVWVLRGGAVLAMVGMLTVILAPDLPIALVGWALFGVGLAGGLPQVFTAAGNLGGPTSGRTLSRVVGVGYLAILGGPALIGWMVELVSWTGALLVPLCAMLVCVLTAPVVARAKDV